MGTRPRPLIERPRRPYSDRLGQLDRYLARPEVAAAIEAACNAHRCGSRNGRIAAPDRVVEVLRLLVLRTRTDGTVAETVAQLAAANPFWTDLTVQRSIRVLRAVEVDGAPAIEVIERPVSPGRNGGQGRPPVYRLTFLTPGEVSVLVPAAPVDNSESTARRVDHSDGMPRASTPNAPRVVQPPSVLIPRNVENISDETLIVPTTTPAESTDTPDTHRRWWCTELARRIRDTYALTMSERAEVMALAEAAHHRWGTLDPHLDEVVAWTLATWTGDRIEVERLAEHLAREEQSIEVAV